MSYTTNPTWKDGTSGGTLVTAASLNHMESGILEASQRLDALGTTNADSVLRTEVLGSQTRTTRSEFIAYLNVTGTVIAGAADSFAWQGWQARKDTDSGYHQGTGLSDFSYYLIPATRRYDIILHGQGTAGASGSYLNVKVTRNAPSVSASIASDVSGVAAGMEVTVNATRLSYPLSAGDKLYWSYWCSTSNVTINTAFGSLDNEIVIRDAGPV